MSDAQKDHGAQWRQEWADAQRLRKQTVSNMSVFYRNIEEELDRGRQHGLTFPIHIPSHITDFSSCDTLGMGYTGSLKEEYLKELDANPNYYIGATGSRLLDGSSAYNDVLEKEIADMFNVESALVLHSGNTANQAIFSTVPRSGDVIVYDELMHATALTGMKSCLALEQIPFRHNDVEHFIEVMESVKETMPLIKSGKRTVIVAVESWYSMDGDICPLKELIDAAKDIFPQRNAQFIVDEAHSFGATGPDGLGFVEDLGLGHEVAIRMITFTKALAGSGAAILSNNTIRHLLANQAKVFICSVAPAFTLLASSRAGLRLMRTKKYQDARDYLEHITRFYLDTLTSHPTYKKAHKKGMLHMPVHEDGDWHNVPITHIVPLWVNKQKYAMYLAFHLTRDGFNGCHIVFPIVGKGEDRVRLIMHAHNTEDDVKRLVDSICAWAQEMMDIEAGPDKKKLPSAARLAYDLIEKDRQAVDEPNGMNGMSGMNGANGHNGTNGTNEGTYAVASVSNAQGIANGSNEIGDIIHRTKGIAV